MVYVPPLAVTVLNRYDLLRTMLASLDAGTLRPERILVLDNGNGMRTDVRKNGTMPLWDRTEVSRSDKGPGARSLAASWNQALRWSGFSEAVVIANDDLTWAPDAYEVLAAGIRYGQPDLATTASVGGFVCFAITPQLRAEVGTFDERFFPAYFEDEDYRYRMKLLGYVPRSVDGCVIQHVESGSIQGMDPTQQDVFKVHFQRSAMLYRQKWGGMVGEETCTEPAL